MKYFAWYYVGKSELILLLKSTPPFFGVYNAFLENVERLAKNRV